MWDPRTHLVQKWPALKIPWPWCQAGTFFKFFPSAMDNTLWILLLWEGYVFLIVSPGIVSSGKNRGKNRRVWFIMLWNVLIIYNTQKITHKKIDNEVLLLIRERRGWRNINFQKERIAKCMNWKTNSSNIHLLWQIPDYYFRNNSIESIEYHVCR